MTSMFDPPSAPPDFTETVMEQIDDECDCWGEFECNYHGVKHDQDEGRERDSEV